MLSSRVPVPMHQCTQPVLHQQNSGTTRCGSARDSSRPFAPNARWNLDDRPRAAPLWLAEGCGSLCRVTPTGCIDKGCEMICSQARIVERSRQSARSVPVGGPGVWEGRTRKSSRSLAAAAARGAQRGLSTSTTPTPGSRGRRLPRCTQGAAGAVIGAALSLLLDEDGRAPSS